MAANDVPLDILHYVSDAPSQASVTPEEYRDTLRGHCRDHWDWSPIINFAHEYFVHLGLAMYDLSSPQTVPTSGGDETPQIQSLEEIQEILERFGTPGHSNQKEMIELVILFSPTVSPDLLLKRLIEVRERDGNKCPVTNWPFDTNPPPALGRVSVEAQLAHICPTKLANHIENPLVYQAFATFWDDEELTKRFATLVNSPESCLLLSFDAHNNLDEMCWAIEAIENVNQDAWEYYFVKLGGLTFPFEPAGGTRIKFGVEGGPFKSAIPMPSPDLCNLRLAVMKVMRLSGAAQAVGSWKFDYDDGSKAICGVLGHPYTDMVAMEKLHAQFNSISA
ncbi:uncharacterized protein EV420DRAFT_1694667 [Desarmillaria tabescens]|uniref:Uncharacterized protein n=1 Tax=Armillaria tabescens TaxID=1929756 RepID=A0AA39K8N6_ARMTA|nr:uncharacterized protein EV420DRAFT_1694667 [Desarmillaria tabescens]KAK0455274.1 hypothetical protein EV420DRAFT_1694667 [Desarmillaria tabescens]